MAARASAVLALAALGVAVTAFALVEAMAGSWACAVGCTAAVASLPVVLLAVLGALGLVVAGAAAGSWLRSVTPRREWDARRAR